MTLDQRRAAVIGLWRSARSLVPMARRDAFADLQMALEAIYDDHADACATAAHRDAQQVANERLETIKRDAFRAGMIAVQKRSDYRDVDDIRDPEELRDTH